MKTPTRVLCISIFLVSIVGGIGTNGLLGKPTYAQLLNDRDNDGIEDEMDPCPDDPDTQCLALENQAVLPGINAPIDQIQPEAGDQVSQDQGQFTSDPSQDQVSIKECYLSSGQCTVNDILLDDNNVVICDPRQFDCSSSLTSSATADAQDQTATPPTKPVQKTEPDNKVITQITYCNPYTNTCNPTDVLVDDLGSIVCDPRLPVYDCSQFFKTQGPPPEVVTCTPSLQTCNPNDVLLDESGNTLCDPRVNDCSKYLVSTPAPKAKPNVFHSLWIHYPIPDEQGLAEAQEKQQEQDEIDNFACEFAEHASEAVGAFYTCAKAGQEFKNALKDPTKVVSLKEVAFCGFGVGGQFEKKVAILDPVGWLAGKEGKLTCKGTLAIRDWLTDKGNILEKFLVNDYDRIEKERKTWCTNYGATLDEFGHCWDLEIAYDNCAKAQKFWSTTDPEKYGVGKMIKLRDGFETTNQLGTFEYPCSFPPILAPEDQVCTEVNSCPIEQDIGSGG